jgi:hypothetical protein
MFAYEIIIVAFVIVFYLRLPAIDFGTYLFLQPLFFSSFFF